MTTSDSNGIGLIAWGMKLGIQNFFHSPNLNPDNDSIKDTLEDIRGLIRINHAGQVFYSMDFTSAHKVYTLYKTIHDWDNRVNAYLALSIFVPYTYDPAFRARDLLLDLLNIYDTKYIDEAMRIKRIPREDPQDFFIRLPQSAAAAALQEGTFSRPTDPAARKYGYIRYQTDPQLDDYLANPYLPEYRERGVKEIFFLPEGSDKLVPGEQLLSLTDVQPQPLRFKLGFSFKDNTGVPLSAPFECTLNGKNYNDQPEVYLFIGIDTPEVQIKLNKQGFNDYLANLSLQSYFAHAQGGSYSLQLAPKTYTLTIEVKAQPQDHKANIRPVSNALVKLTIISKSSSEKQDRQCITNEQGYANIINLRYGDRVSGKVQADGFEDGIIDIPDLKDDVTGKIISLRRKETPVKAVHTEKKDSNAEGLITKVEGQMDVDKNNLKEKYDKKGPNKDKKTQKSFFNKTNVVTLLIVLGIIAIASSSLFIFKNYQAKKDKLSSLKNSLISYTDSLTNPEQYPMLKDLDTLLTQRFYILDQLIIEKSPNLDTFAKKVDDSQGEHLRAIQALKKDTLQAIKQRLDSRISNTTTLSDSIKMRSTITKDAQNYFLTLIQAEKQSINQIVDALKNNMLHSLGAAAQQAEKSRLEALSQKIRTLFDIGDWRSKSTNDYKQALTTLNANPALFGSQQNLYLNRIAALEKVSRAHFIYKNKPYGSEKSKAGSDLEALKTSPHLSSQQKSIITSVLSGN